MHLSLGRWERSENLSLDWLFSDAYSLEQSTSQSGKFGAGIFWCPWEDGRKGTEGEGKKPGEAVVPGRRGLHFSREGDDQCHSHTQGASLGLAP